jgi:predicted DNA-binding transcriptional regulator AlpA
MPKNGDKPESKPLPKVGRPTKYEDWMPDKAIEIMSNGKAKVEVAAELGVSEATFYSWCKTTPEFLKAIKIGMTLSQAWWLNKLRENVTNNKFNTPAFKVAVANLFGMTSSISEHRVSGSMDLDHSFRDEIDPSKLTDKELDDLIEAQEKVLEKCKVEREQMPNANGRSESDH